MTITELDEANKAKAAVAQAGGEAKVARPPAEQAKLTALSRFVESFA